MLMNKHKASILKLGKNTKAEDKAIILESTPEVTKDKRI